jgi:hypothetical protein
MDETSEPIRRVVSDTDVEPISHVAGVSASRRLCRGRCLQGPYVVARNQCRGRHRIRHAHASCEETEFANARRFGPQYSPTAVSILGGRQFARLGRTHDTDGNQADRSRALITSITVAIRPDGLALLSGRLALLFESMCAPRLFCSAILRLGERPNG